MALVYKIHPAIGIARVGNSREGFFIGPESPGVLPDLSDPQISQPANGKYKDPSGRIKRQGARFRIYEYESAHGDERPLREITDIEADITWQVHLVNRKAAGRKIFAVGDRNMGVPRERLIIDSGSRTINGANQAPVNLEGEFQGQHTNPATVPLGHLRTDEAGRLIVLGGFGTSFSPTGQGIPPGEFANNDDWCDDVSDGPVTATLRMRDTGQILEIQDSSWVIASPPDFAPPIGNVITLFDIVYDSAVSQFNVHLDELLRQGRISFTRHIYPLLKRASDVFWVDSSALIGTVGHMPGRGGDFLKPELIHLLSDNNADTNSPAFKARNVVLKKLRKPDGTGGNMPKLNREQDTGRQPRLTGTSYRIMERWAKGEFEADWQGEPVPAQLLDLPVEEQPFTLDKAALDACVGASFYPGIEAPRVMRDDPGIYQKPFRINPGLFPGIITQSMAVPWQADFADCGRGWWPAQRPNDIFRQGQRSGWADGVFSELEMVTKWSQLGFIVSSTSGDLRYIEDEREL